MRLWSERCWLVWFVAVGATLVVGCGGTSSETPEPVRPDSWQLKLRHQRQLSSRTEEEPHRALNLQESFEDPTKPPSTWGNAGAKSRLAPKPSTTEAVPASDVALEPVAPVSATTPTSAPAPTPAAKPAKPAQTSNPAAKPAKPAQTSGTQLPQQKTTN